MCLKFEIIGNLLGQEVWLGSQALCKKSQLESEFAFYEKYIDRMVKNFKNIEQNNDSADSI